MQTGVFDKEEKPGAIFPGHRHGITEPRELTFDLWLTELIFALRSKAVEKLIFICFMCERHMSLVEREEAGLPW